MTILEKIFYKFSQAPQENSRNKHLEKTYLLATLTIKPKSLNKLIF